MSAFNFFADLRSALVDQIGGIENAQQTLWWDDTKSNVTIRYELSDIFSSAVKKASNFGIFIVTRHSECPNKNHPEYPTSNRYGIDIKYRDKNYLWNGGQIFQGQRNCVCPCSSKNKSTVHYVIDDIVFNSKADYKTCVQVESVLTDISDAIRKAGARQPRSGIREHLLRALITLNDAILPETVQEYIARKRAGGGLTA